MSDLQAACEAEIARLWSGQRDGAHDLGHLRRVWANARIIMAEEPGADPEVLLIAAYFHDAVNLTKDDPDRALAATRSGAVAAEWLAGRGFAPDRIAATVHAIEAHSFSAGLTPQTPEARILQDADRLEALGAIGIARMFCVAGAMGAALFDPDDPMAERRALDDRRYALDHLQVKLFGLAETMQTRTGTQMAEARVDWMASFRTRLLAEVAGRFAI